MGHPHFDVYRQIPTPILITDVRGAIEYVNPAFTRLTGYTRRGLAGKNPRMLSAGKTPRSVYKKMWSTILSGRTWHGELKNRRKDGRLYLESIFIAPLKNRRGKISHFVASWQDVTRRAQAARRLKWKKRALERVSLRDDLTGLYNRRGLFALMEHQIRLSQRRKSPIAVLYIDIDDLKQINDRFGHKTGDRALIEAARLLSGSFRASDIVSRVGGDEFVVAAIDSVREGLRVIERRLRSRFKEYNESDLRRPYRLEVSLGSILIGTRETSSLETLLEKADRLMYLEKHKKKIVKLHGLYVTGHT